MRCGASGRTLLVTLVVGVVVGVGVYVPGTWRYGVLLGWISAAAVFLGWMWGSIWPRDAERTAAHAAGENPGPGHQRPAAMSIAACASALPGRSSTGGQSASVELCPAASRIAATSGPMSGTPRRPPPGCGYIRHAKADGRSGVGNGSAPMSRTVGDPAKPRSFACSAVLTTTVWIGA